VSKARIVLEIVNLLQGTPVAEFARENFYAAHDRASVRCAQTATLPGPAGELCKRAVATALQRYSYRFTATQLGVLADLYVATLEQLEPSAVPRVRRRMCDPSSDDAVWDPDAARAVCERLSKDS
jgi:hypothetical protein